MTGPSLCTLVRDALDETLDEIERAENAGDELADLDESDCIDPLGHLFLTSCGETKCVHCGRIAWS